MPPFGPVAGVATQSQKMTPFWLQLRKEREKERERERVREREKDRAGTCGMLSSVYGAFWSQGRPKPMAIPSRRRFWHFWVGGPRLGRRAGRLAHKPVPPRRPKRRLSEGEAQCGACAL